MSARLHRQCAGDELDVVALHVGDDHDAHLNERRTQKPQTFFKQHDEKRRRDAESTNTNETTNVRTALQCSAVGKGQNKNALGDSSFIPKQILLLLSVTMTTKPILDGRQNTDNFSSNKTKGDGRGGKTITCGTAPPYCTARHCCQKGIQQQKCHQRQFRFRQKNKTSKARLQDRVYLVQ